MTTPDPAIERLYATTDAAEWAEEFMKVASMGATIDFGLMVGWFANAIETAKRHRLPAHTPEPYRPPSIADGTVAQGLIDGLTVLGDEYGPRGVVNTAIEMWPAAHTPEPCSTCGDTGTVYTRMGPNDWDMEECPDCHPRPGEDAAMVKVCRAIRAGWLPHRLSSGSWWWGRPSADDGFRLWSTGVVPTMSVVERMTDVEVIAWVSTLHPAAPEALAVAVPLPAPSTPEAEAEPEVCMCEMGHWSALCTVHPNPPVTTPEAESDG